MSGFFLGNPWAPITEVYSHLESMAFGYGRHACPGRFFASAEIKAIMVYLPMNYDFKFPDDRTERPPSLIFETQNSPNHMGRILFKRRQMAA